MADATKTVDIIFDSDVTQAEVDIKKLDAALTAIDQKEFDIEVRSKPIEDLNYYLSIAADKSATLEARTTALSNIYAGDLTKNVGGVNQTLDVLEKELGQTTEATDRHKDAAQRNSDALKESAVSVDKAVLAFKALAASFVVKEWIEANANAEQFRLTMGVVTGSSEGAAKEFEYLKDVANRMGLEIDSAAKSYSLLAAATKGTALEGDGAKVIFEAVAGTLSQLGRSSADVERALTQVQQGVSKNKFELEDLKSIASVMPGFFDQFAASLNKTTPELFALVKEGKIGAQEFLTFANTLNEGLAEAKFSTYQANLNRLTNAVKEAFVIIGDSGAWDIFVKGLQLGTTAIVGAVSSMQLLYDLAKILVDQSLKLSLFSTETGDKMQAAFFKAADAMRPASNALLGISEETTKVGFNAVEAGKNLEAAGQQAEKFSLKAFDTLVKTTTSSEELAKATAQLAIEYAKGNISAGDYYSRLDDVQKAQLAMDKAVGGATTRLLEQEPALKKAADAAKKAEDAAKKYELELEKIASNERIKLIEAAVKLDIAEVEANAKIAVAAFESIDNAVTQTTKGLTDMLGLLVGGTKDWATWRIITEEIEKQSTRLDEQLKKQSELIDAQIALQRAKAESLQAGGALIKVDGAGLQPQLEAFMWEILKTIQVRVNAEGLEMLTGL